MFRSFAPRELQILIIWQFVNLSFCPYFLLIFVIIVKIHIWYYHCCFNIVMRLVVLSRVQCIDALVDLRGARTTEVRSANTSLPKCEAGSDLTVRHHRASQSQSNGLFVDYAHL
jgi:hypothetical protein